MPDIATTPEIDLFLAQHSPVAIGVSGGKDSCALAFALQDYLDGIGHQGPRVLVHSDLGRIEWRDSLPTCERLARATGLELMVVRREKGDMVDRWKQRWADNVQRYRTLSCVQLILPWSTPAMRFCTSEMKVDIICRAVARRFPNHTIISASGIRADESDQRAKAPVSKTQAKLKNKTLNTWGLDWAPLLRWTEAQVFDCMTAHGFEWHEAYRVYNSSRVSCCYCIMSTMADLMASASCPDNQEVYRELVDLEIESTFGFQGQRWLGEVAPHLLSEEQREGVFQAKQRAAQREKIEALIPRDLLYVKGWPTRVPTWDEADLLAYVRTQVSEVVGIEDMECLTAATVVERYEQLMEAKLRKEAATAA